MLKCLCLGHKHQGWISSVTCNREVVPVECSLESKVFKLEEVKAAQYADEDLGHILKYVQEGSVPSCDERSAASRPLKNLMDNVRKLKLRDGVLFRVSGGRTQLVLLKVYRTVVLKELHESMGHVHCEKVLSLLRPRFYWPFMQADVEDHVLNCHCVVQQKVNRKVNNIAD